MTWTAYEIPLISHPQQLTVTLAGTAYQMTVRWNAALATWMLDIANQNGSPLVQGIPLLTGRDLLSQYKYLGIGGKLVVQTDQNAYALPTATNLGTDSHLYFLVSS